MTLHLTENALRILEKRYFLRDRQGRLIETPEGLFRRVARCIASAESGYGAKPVDVRHWEDLFYDMMTNAEFLPNTPTLMNAGAPLGQLSACFVLPIDDSISGIFETLKLAAEVHKSGGGTGFDFSPIRPAGDLVGCTSGTASGPVSFIRIFDVVADVIKQGGKRRGANMGILRVDHPDILEFIESKTSQTVLHNFNISVSVTDAFLRAVLAGQTYKLRNPRTGRTVGEASARQVFDRIVASAWRGGEPGLIFIDEVNRKNPTRNIGPIAATNPCGEVPLHPWESCNLGSINLVKAVRGDNLKGEIDWDRLRELTHVAVRFLDDVIDVNRFPLPQIGQAVRANRRIGLGIMGFAEALIRLGIPYDSDEALETGRRLMAFVRREGHAASQKLGRERGSFPNFRGSLWQKKGYRHMRNATVTTVAPTGTISVIAGCSSGIEPIFAVSFVRNVLDGAHLVETVPLFKEIAQQSGVWTDDLSLHIAKTGTVADLPTLPEKIRRLFRTAHEIDVNYHVKMQAVFQKSSDNAVSKTINLPETAPEEAVRQAYLMAWKLKCKGITVYRNGSRPGQALTLGSYDQIHKDHALMGAESEFAGGCPSGVCAYATT